MMIRSATSALALFAAIAAAPAMAQDAPPPIGITIPDLAPVPYIFDSAEQHGVKVSVLAKGFARPFALETLPNGDLLVMERGGDLRIIPNGEAMREAPVAGMPKLDPAFGNVGVHDINVHPDFANNGLIYWTWNDPIPNPEDASAQPQEGLFMVMRGRLVDGAMTDVETIFETDQAAYPGGSRVVVAKDGMVWLSTGAPFGPLGKDLSSIYGKVLRLNGDGSVPADNPFVGQSGAHPAIYSYGHRDQHGLVVHPETGQVFSAEHGPNGGDEANLIKPGANYGWPDYSFGRNYDGTPMVDTPIGEGIELPLITWLPSIAPSGLMFYTGDKFPAWKGNLFIGSARRGEVNGTGGLERIAFNDDFGELRRETLLTQLHQRVRDMVQGPDGNIYVVTDGPEHAVLKLEPSGP